MGLFSRYRERIEDYLGRGNSKKDERIKDDINYFRNERDPERNEQSTPAENVRIHLPSIWVFEAYPPSYIESLTHGFEKLDLVDQIERNYHRNILDQLNIMRSSGYRSSWYNLGVIVPPSSSNLPPSIEAPLPEGIKYASSYLYQFVPSTTILATQFYLEDDLSNSLEKPLRKYYKTYPEKISNGTKFHSPIHQKQEAYNLRLEFLRTKCTEWISTYFPGLFSSDFFDRAHPTVELILLENDNFINDSYNPYGSYLNIMGIETDHQIYECLDVEGLLMTVNEKYLAKRSSMTIGGNIEKVLTEEKLKGYGENRIDSIPSWLSYLSKTLSFWSLTDLVFGYDQKLKNIRDELGAIDTTDPDYALEKLKIVEDKISNIQMNSTLFAKELVDSIGRPSFFDFNIFDFSLMAERQGEDLTFLEARKNVLKRTAESIQANNAHINKISDRLSNLVTNQVNLKLSESNNKLQFWILILTIIVVLVTIFNQINLDSILSFIGL